MKTFDLDQAATFLKMAPEVLRRKAHKGEIPGAKPGRRWCFHEDDLAHYLRSFYATPAKSPWGVVQSDRRTTWHSTKEETSGGSASVNKEKEYSTLLGLPIK